MHNQTYYETLLLGVNMEVIKIFLVLTLISSCAAKKLAIKNADTLIEYQLEKRLPLYSKQEDDLSKDVDKLLQQLKPRARELLTHADKLAPNDFESQYVELNHLFKKVSIQFSHLLSKYMAILDQKQEKEFLDNLKNENLELIIKGPKDFTDRFQVFFGDPNSKQEELYKEYRPYFKLRFEEKVLRRKKLREKFMVIYHEENDPARRQRKFIDAFTDFQMGPYKNEKAQEILQKLIPTLSNEQKDHFKKAVAEFKDLINLFIRTEY